MCMASFPGSLVYTHIVCFYSLTLHSQKLVASEFENQNVCKGGKPGNNAKVYLCI